MPQIDLSSYKDLYAKTAREYLGKLDENLASLKNNPDNQEIISLTHLNIHSLGSQSYAMGYDSTGALARVMEAFFHVLKEEKKSFPMEQSGNIEIALQKIRDSVTNIETSNQELDLSSDETMLSESLSGK